MKRFKIGIVYSCVVTELECARVIHIHYYGESVLVHENKPYILKEKPTFRYIKDRLVRCDNIKLHLMSNVHG